MPMLVIVIPKFGIPEFYAIKTLPLAAPVSASSFYKAFRINIGEYNDRNLFAGCVRPC